MSVVREVIGVTRTVIMLLVLMHVAVTVAIVLTKMDSPATVDSCIPWLISLTNFDHLSDINECSQGTDECDHHCYNTIGGYFCNCTGPGYRLHTDDATCQSEFFFNLWPFH